jgi:putative oxygen-independent coproporphyrinogen III oxidase
MCQPGIYVHIPFCEKKCPYCDFTSGKYEDNLIEPYLRALENEITLRAGRGSTAVAARTIYWGGGTPTFLSREQIRRLGSRLKAAWKIEPAAEYTAEANPGTLTNEKVEVLLEAGINRISLGSQSFSGSELRFLGRIHDSGQIENSVRLLKKHNVGNFSLDLMFGIPGQTRQSWRDSLNRALACEPAHLSLYNLTYHPGTEFYKDLKSGRLVASPEDDELFFYDLALELTEKSGLRQYEISNFARPGFEAEHNAIYWANESYVGIGLSAVSYLDGARISNTTDIREYISLLTKKNPELPEADIESLKGYDLATETVILGLRRNRGITWTELEDRFEQVHISEIKSRLESLVEPGLVMLSTGGANLTKNGFILSNEVFLRLLPD